MFTINLDLPQVLNLLLAVVFPILVGLVTKTVTSSRVKAILLATITFAVTFVTALLSAVLAGEPLDVIGTLLTCLAAWLIAVASHFGLWKPTGVAAAAQRVGT